MRTISKIIITGAALAALGLVGVYAYAQDGSGFGPGRMGMPRMGMGSGMMGGMGSRMMTGGAHGSATTAEHAEIRDLFVNHDRIKRTVTNLPNGIRTVTESDDPELARVIISHVKGMGERVDAGRDPRLPIESEDLHRIFRDKDKIVSSYETTPKGIIVVQTSTDAGTVAALQAHAAEVSELARLGMPAAHEAMMQRMGGDQINHDHGAGPDQRRRLD